MYVNNGIRGLTILLKIGLSRTAQLGIGYSPRPVSKINAITI